MESTDRNVSVPCRPFHVAETHLSKDEAELSEQKLMVEMEKITYVPEEDLQSLLMNAIKGMKISGISSVFFNDAESSSVWAGQDHTETVANIAVPLLAWKICKVSGAKNNGNETLALQKWMLAVQSREASLMSQDMRKQWLMDKLELKPYFENTDLWGHLLEEKILSLEQKTMDENYFWKSVISAFKEQVFLKEVEQACNRPEKVGSNLVLYGNDVKSWLSDPRGPTAHGLVINWGSFKTEFVPNLGIGGCFTAGTQILIDQGNGISIEYLKNKYIVGNDGILGYVSDNKTQQVTKTSRKIYGFNCGKPFFTGDHPFMTQEGWKAIDPQIAKSVNRWLTVGQLQIGDFVKKLSKYDRRSKSAVYKWEQITDLPSATIPKGQTIYNIHFSEGLQSCHANSYVAYINYPEIGSNSLKKQEEFTKQTISGSTNTFVKDILEIPPKQALKHHVPLEEVYLADMNITYPLHSEEHTSIPKEHSQLLDNLPSNIRVDHGTIYLDDVHIHSSAQISAHQLAWTRELPYGGLEEGVIHFHPHRLSGYGKIMLTSRGIEMLEPYVISFNAHLSSHSFVCDLFTSNNVKYEGEQRGIQSFHLGHDQGPTHAKLTSKVEGMLPYLELFDIGHSMNFNVTEWNEATFEISVTPEYRPLIGFAHLSGVFSWDYTRFTGKAIQYDPYMLGGEGMTFSWNGRLAENQQSTKIEKTPTEIKLQSVSTSTTAALNSMRSRTIPLNTQQKSTSDLTSNYPMMTTPLNKQQKSFAALTSISPVMTLTPNIQMLSEHLTVELNLTDLTNITPPDQTEVHTLTFSMVKEAMAYVISDEWRNDLLDISKPDLLYGMDKIAEQFKNMLIKKYGVGYLTHGLANGNLYKKKFSDMERNKVLFFWAGTEDGCLAKDADFSNMYFSTSLIAFKLLTPTLKKYLDSADPAGWAKKLHDYLVEPSQLDRYASSTDTNGTTEILQKQCMVLQSLAPTQKYGTDLYTKVVLRNLEKRVDFFIGTNTMDMMAFMDESNKNIIERVLEKDPKFNETYIGDMDKVIQDAIKELKLDTAGKPSRDIAWLLSKEIHGLMSQFLNIWKEKTGTLWWRHSEAITSFFNGRPGYFLTAKLVSNLFGIASWGMAMYGTIKTFMGWKTLSTEQKVAAIFNTVNFAVASISRIKNIVIELNEVRKGFYNSHFVRRMVAGADDPQVTALFEEQAIEMTGIVNEASSFEETIAEAAARNSESEDAIDTSTARVQEEFSILEKTAQATTVLALVAASVALGFRIYNDLKDGQPGIVAVMDIMQEVVMGLQISIGVMRLLNLAPNFIDMASLPIVGSVLAIAGIIMYLVSTFSEKDKPPPESPAEKFITKESKPFVLALKEPTQKWMDDYNKHHLKTK